MAKKLQQHDKLIIAANDKVQELDLSSNEYNSMSPKVALLTSLEKFTFSDNGLTHLPPQIGQLKKPETFRPIKKQIKSPAA